MLIPLIPKITEPLLVPRVSFLDFSEAIKQFQHFKRLPNDLNTSFRFLPKKERLFFPTINFKFLQVCYIC